MTDMVDDPKIRRLIRKHGALGYAVYNLAIERIGKKLTTEAPLPDLEETAEDIADMLQADTMKVEQVMQTCLTEGLFEVHEVTGKVLCAKIYKFIEKSQTRSMEVRAMIDAYRNVSEKLLLSETVSDSPRQTETVSDCPDRTEQNRTEQNTDTKVSSQKPDIDRVCHKRIIDKLNQEAGTHYTHTAKATQRLIKSRWNEGYRYDDFERVILAKADEWKSDEKMVQYLRPQTLFGTKFEAYLQVATPVKKGPTYEVIDEG